LQEQFVSATLPAAAPELSGHRQQASGPVTVLYVPLAQGAQRESSRVNPALQRQSDTSPLPTSESELLRHATHWPSLLAAATSE
jgi:hypothetical protein